MTHTAVFETEAEMMDAIWTIKDEGATILAYGQEASGWWTVQYET